MTVVADCLYCCVGGQGYEGESLLGLPRQIVSAGRFYKVAGSTGP